MILVKKIGKFLKTPDLISTAVFHLKYSILSSLNHLNNLFDVNSCFPSKIADFEVFALRK